MRKYPRIPHVAPGHGITADDLMLTPAERARLLAGRVVLEEKLDGANISIRLDEHGGLLVASRGGPGAMDRGGVLGRARAWLAPLADELRPILADGRILFAEWLLAPHTVRYESLPAPLIALDIANAAGGFLTLDERNLLLDPSPIHTAPLIAIGTFTLDEIDAKIGPSRFGAPHAEGIIIRSASQDPDAPRVAKRVAATFERASNAELARARTNYRI